MAGTLDVGDDPAEALAFRFFPARPNPVRAGATVAFDLPRPSRVTLSVFDVSGRLVRRSDFGRLAPGHQSRAWNANDDRGTPLPNGVYFLRLETERERGVHKVLVLR